MNSTDTKQTEWGTVEQFVDFIDRHTQLSEFSQRMGCKPYQTYTGPEMQITDLVDCGFKHVAEPMKGKTYKQERAILDRRANANPGLMFVDHWAGLFARERPAESKPKDEPEPVKPPTDNPDAWNLTLAEYLQTVRRSNETITLQTARYAKGKMLVRLPSNGGYKTAAHFLAECLGGRFVGREKGYILSPNQVTRLLELHARGCNGAKVFSKQITTPEEEHLAAVEFALRESLPVRAEVLGDYPDLKGEPLAPVEPPVRAPQVLKRVSLSR